MSVLGYKAGFVSGGIFSSPVFRYDWPDNKAIARCRRTVGFEHLAPNEECDCGIYVTKDIGYATSFGPILCLVEVGGRVIEHEQGWKAGEARIIGQYTFDGLLLKDVPVLPLPKDVIYSDYLYELLLWRRVIIPPILLRYGSPLMWSRPAVRRQFSRLARNYYGDSLYSVLS